MLMATTDDRQECCSQNGSGCVGYVYGFERHRKAERAVAERRFISGAVRCRFPKLPPMVGYAATGRIRTPVSAHDPSLLLRPHGLVELCGVAPEPRCMVLQDADHKPGLGAFVGEIHADHRPGVAMRGLRHERRGARSPGRRSAWVFRCLPAALPYPTAYAHIIEFGEPVEIGGLKISSGRFDARRPPWGPHHSRG